jgi:hypothetical protein
MLFGQKQKHRPPEILGDVDPAYVDTLLSDELRQLDFKTRDEIQEELHGVRTLAREETSEMIETALIQLQKELDNIPLKKAYDESQMHTYTYVNSRAFRIKMLRGDLFDEKAAAIRIVKFLEFMKDYYGPEILIRPPRLSDLGEEEMELLKAGGMQMLPCRDRSGRKMFIIIGGHGLGYSVYSRVRRICHWKSMFQSF